MNGLDEQRLPVEGYPLPAGLEGPEPSAAYRARPHRQASRWITHLQQPVCSINMRSTGKRDSSTLLFVSTST